MLLIEVVLENLLKTVQLAGMRANLLQSCLIVCNSMDCSPPGSSIHGILQARILEQVRILERVAMPSSRGSS